uniref:Uncharacterized protein n=1 Tax=Octopus bimaculoides TaxID=37653 RepID=A0A0L8IEM1_OCTBM
MKMNKIILNIKKKNYKDNTITNFIYVLFSIVTYLELITSQSIFSLSLSL